MKFTLFSLFLFITSSLFPQGVSGARQLRWQEALDSVKQFRSSSPPIVIDICEREIKAASQNNRFIRIFHNQLAAAYRTIGKHEKALEVAKKGYALSRWAGDDLNKARALKEIGSAAFRLDYYDEALGYYIKSASIFERLNEKDNYASLYLNIGVVYLQKGNLVKALEYEVTANKIFKELDNKKGMAQTITNIGYIYSKLGDYKKSLDNYILGYQLFKEVGNVPGMAVAAENIGSRYADLENYTEAERYFTLSIKHAESIGSQRSIASATEHLAEIEIRQGKLKEARTRLLLLLQYNMSQKNRLMVAANRIQLAEIHILEKSYAEALSNLEEAEVISDSIGSIEMSKDIYELKSEIYYEREDFKNSIHYHGKADKLRDSLVNENSLKIINELKAKFELEQKDNEITRLELKYNELLVIFLVIGIFLGVAVIALLFNRNRILKRVNSELELKSEELVSARDESERQNELKSEFLAQISHEIRSPISIILNFSALLREETEEYISQTSKDYFVSIDRAGSRIIRTIDLILNMSDIQKGTYKANMTILRLVEDIVRPLVEEYCIKAKVKKLSLNLVASEIPYVFEGDRFTITQIFSNLIDNAVKYTQEGSVDVIAEHDEDCYKFKIKDTGIGISQEFLPRLFDPFSQEEQGYSRAYEGSGLGMALVKKYCDLNNATISVSSLKNKGTEFIIRFTKNTSSM